MEKQVCLAMAITLSFGLCAAKGLCQAAAEYAITTSHAATATAKAGSALDKATQQLSGRLQDRLSKSTEQPRQTSRQPSRGSGDRPVPKQAQTIESVNGMEIISSPSDTKLKAGSPSNPCTPSPAKALPGTKTNLPCKHETQEKYPSVLNLSFSR